MAPIDRLGWAGGLSIRPHGITFGVRCNEEWLLERVQQEILLPNWQVGPYQHEILYSFFAGGERRKGVRNFTLLYEGNSRLGRSHDFEEIYQMFEQTLHTRVASFSTHANFVRGLSLVVDGEAVAVLNADQQWLADYQKGLRKRHARLLSAKYIVLDQLGFVHPYPNRVELKGQFQDPGLLGLTLFSEALPLGRVLVANGPRIGSLSSAEIVWHLFGNLQSGLGPANSIRHLSQAVRLRSARGRAVENTDRLLTAI